MGAQKRMTKDDQEEKMPECVMVNTCSFLGREEELDSQHATNKFQYYALADDGLIRINSPISALTLEKTLPVYQQSRTCRASKSCDYVVIFDSMSTASII
jgi:hypothetical protein